MSATADHGTGKVPCGQGSLTDSVFRPDLLLLAGRRGAGKSTLAKRLGSSCHFEVHELSRFLSEMRLDSGHQSLRLRRFVSWLHRTRGRDYAVRELLRRRLDGTRDAVIVGIRNCDEITYLIKEATSYRVIPVYVSCPMFCRIRRVVARGERASFLEFLIEELYSLAWGDKDVKQSSNVLVNKGAKEAAMEHVVSLLRVHAYKNSDWPVPNTEFSDPFNNGDRSR